ncbi:MAG TPA: hypothetical protein O0X70_08190 [Methanocorpusculum sp.]|nr:hypothetical protein [Methanocorpusculum sp.]
MKHPLKKTTLIFLTGISLLFLVIPAGAAGQQETPASNYVEGQLFLCIDTTAAEITDFVSENEIITDYSSDGFVPGLYLIQTPKGMNVEEAVAYFSKMEQVKYAEPNYIVTIDNEPEKTDKPASPLSTAMLTLAVFAGGLIAARKK